MGLNLGTVFLHIKVKDYAMTLSYIFAKLGASGTRKLVLHQTLDLFIFFNMNDCL